jgi:hypothetical protein
MNKYTNKQHTDVIVENIKGAVSGTVKALTRSGHLTPDSMVADFVEPLPTAKQRRDEALAALSYQFADGGVIQTSPVSRGPAPSDEANIRNAIEFMGKHDELQVMSWVMADNSKRDLTVAELQEALDGSQLLGVQIWAEYDPEG